MPNGNTAGAERQYRAMDGAVPNRDTEGANRRDYSLIIDDWLLEPLAREQAREVLELVESRYRTGSLILCSQYAPAGWHERLGEQATADAVVDRIVYRSTVITIEGAESMRKRMAGPA